MAIWTEWELLLPFSFNCSLIHLTQHREGVDRGGRHVARQSTHIQAFPGPQTASFSKHGFPFILWPLGFLEAWKHRKVWGFWLLGTTLESGPSGRARLLGHTAFGGTVSIQHSPHPAPGPEPVTRGFDCLGNQCGGSGEESRVGTTDPSENNRAQNPKGLTASHSRFGSCL